MMHAHIPVLTETSSVRDAVDKMDIYQFPALVVVNEDRLPVAVLTEGDVCRGVSVRDSLSVIGTEPALAFATKDPTCATPDEEIGDAFHRMLSSGLTILPVVEDGNLAGIVLRCDLMQALLMDASC